MVEKKELAVALRTTVGKDNKKLLKAGIIPGNISGHNQESQPVQVDALAFATLRRNHAATGVIQLIMANAPAQMVLIRHVQHAPTTGKAIHIDFSRVSMDELITAKVPLRFVGESPSVKNKGGVLLHLLDTVEAECPASNIAEYFEVDISSLTEIDAILYARDIKLPEKYKLITSLDESVAKIAATRAELAAAATPAVADEAVAPTETKDATKA
jgi:large subunit ribosomal protein L25